MTIECATNVSQHDSTTCSATWDGKELRIDAGSIRRTWHRTEQGLCSSALETCLNSLGSENRYQWLADAVSHGSDFCLPIALSGPLHVTHVEIDTHDDDGFSSAHLRVRVFYSHEQFELIQEIWVWYNVGMRIGFRVLGKSKTLQQVEHAYLDRLQLRTEADDFTLWGYYNDTQNRNTAATPILKQERIDSASWTNDWASGCALRCNGHALIVVKESHKCVNQSGIETGAYHADAKSLTVSGWGLYAADINSYNNSDHYAQTWATWYLSAAADQKSIAAAVRRFDRTRFPFNAATDAYVIANTWGSGHYGDTHPGKIGRPERRSAREKVVLSEIESCGDLGIDVLQIDDGWQTPNDEHWDPLENGWHPHSECWPNAWQPAVDSAEKHKVRLGLWAPAESISYKELMENYQSGHFLQYKLDFANFKSYPQLDAVMSRCRNFIHDTQHKTRINWDVTENQTRVGYYYGRDLGATFLANRKPDRPESTIYEPWLMLRDCWQLSQYLSLKQFQISAQNPKHTDKRSEAHLHNISYCHAISCSGLPLLFHRTSLYDEQQRQETKAWFKGYHEHKIPLHQADCQPIGDEPNNKNWTGFHYTLNEDSGYVLVFRELHNQHADHQLKIPDLAQAKLTLRDCHSGEECQREVDAQGQLALHIENGAGAKLYVYQKVK